MTLESLTDLDVAFGWDGNQSGIADLKSVIQEIRGINFTVVSGAVGTITLTGIAVDDTILAAFELQAPWATTSSGLITRTSNVTITAASQITLAGSELVAGAQLLVIWWDKSGR